MLLGDERLQVETRAAAIGVAAALVPPYEGAAAVELVIDSTRGVPDGRIIRCIGEVPPEWTDMLSAEIAGPLNDN